jgi:diacylglycerol kinase (ATP)
LNQINSKNDILNTGILLNPASGRVRKKIETIRRLISTLNDVDIQEASTLPEINHKVNHFINLNINLLIIIAGDGTVQAILNQYLTNINILDIPSIYIIPGGTTNMTATDIGVHGNPVKFIKRLNVLMTNMDSASSVMRSALLIHQKNRPDLYGMFFGAGIIANGVKYYQRYIKSSGITGEIASFIVMLNFLLKLIFGKNSKHLSPVDVQYQGDNNVSVKVTSLLLFASTLDRLLFGLKPYWGLAQQPVHFTIIRENPANFWHSLFSIINRQTANLLKTDGYFSSNYNKLEIYINGDFIVDGEVFNASNQNGPLYISATKSIRFIVPD